MIELVWDNRFKKKLIKYLSKRPDMSERIEKKLDVFKT